MEFNNDFRHDLKLGQIREKKLQRLLKYKRIEVKADLQAKKTGNVFIEYESRGKKSGIARTEAEWYCYFIDDDLMIMIQTDRLKKLCRSFIGTNQDIKGGDSNTSKGILLTVKQLLNASM